MKIKKIVKDNWLLFVILVIASVLRLYKLGSIPPHLTPDEASLGYNAYSILKTGRDEYGTLLPIIFKSFGDFKPGLYVYASIPSIILFGLNEFAVRLPSALAGIIAVFLVYKIGKHLFQDSPTLGLVSAFVLSISPWHIHFSRGAWEINLSLTLTLCALLLFLKALQKNKLLIPSAVFFALTLLTYQGAKLSTGIVVVLLVLIFANKLLKFKKRVLMTSVILGTLIVLPILLSFTTGQTGRLGVFSVFSYPRPEKYLQDFLDQAGEQKYDLNYYLFHPESLNFARGVLGRYYNHFSGNFLFFEGDWQNPRHTSPNMGVLLFVDLVLLVMGFAFLAQKKLTRESLFILLWLLLAPLPAVLSRDQVHAVRSYSLIVPLTFIISFGLTLTLEKLRSLQYKTLKPLGYGALGVLYLLSFAYFLDAYFIHLPKHDSKYWEYGYKQIVETVTPIQNNYQKVTIQQSYAQPYIYFLFYQKYDPAKYQAQAKLKESEVGDVGQVERLDNICFCAIDWSVNRGDKNSLIVGDPVRIPPQDSMDQSQFKLVDEIKYLNGIDTAFRVIEIK